MRDKFDSKSILYSDTLIPDIFLSEYLPLLSAQAVKVYTFCCFVEKTERSMDMFKIIRRLDIDESELAIILDELTKKHLISVSGRDIFINDIKAIEIDRLYKERTSIKPDDLGEKESVISAINDQFFDGNMPIYMYGCIEQWFKKYRFEDPVMLMLFSISNEKGALTRNYIETVAKDWFENGVKTVFDLEALFNERDKMKDIQNKILKALNRKTAFTQYETDLINKWFNEYRYSFEIIEEALKKTVKISNPNIAYVDKILSNWYENEFKNIDDLEKEKAIKDLSPNELRMMVSEHYQSINMKNSMIFESRKAEIFKKSPQIEKLYNEINDLHFKQAFSPDKKAIAEDIKNKNYEMALLFKHNNIPDDYLVRKYDCDICKDTGVNNGKDCTCKVEFLRNFSLK
ncbi:MAG TPA: DnaD domain protein [Clostridia bacterium]|jgi:DnaD/phage-associated family protein|nr:MAG: DNA replication protein DnaC [Firmicutes bacterium ADurb.Bin146]HOD92781.1 DnaD domain protein [Clostridia bacterium]HQM39551.1 DnaD domain protein [Clostridia bacterium]